MNGQKEKFMPGPCSECDSKKANEQMSCCHPLGALKWGLARYANCTACGLRNCVYQKSEEREENRKDAQHIAALLERDRLSLKCELRRVYDMQLRKGTRMPSPCSEYDPTKANEQISCCHPFGALWWGGNPSRRYAHCTACGLRRCVYQKTTMMREEREKNLTDAQYIDALLENALSWGHGR